MDDFVASFFSGIFEMTLVIIAAAVASVVWCLVVAGFAVGRFGISGVKAAGRIAGARRTRRELAAVLLEYHQACADVRRISDETTRQIRAVAQRGARRP
jgi:hypothetical protein